MASSKSSTAKFGLAWPELRFPPINLWVVASLSALNHEAYVPKQSTSRALQSNERMHATERLHRRLESLLAVRGGKV